MCQTPCANQTACNRANGANVTVITRQGVTPLPAEPELRYEVYVAPKSMRWGDEAELSHTGSCSGRAFARAQELANSDEYGCVWVEMYRPGREHPVSGKVIKPASAIAAPMPELAVPA